MSLRTPMLVTTRRALFRAAALGAAAGVTAVALAGAAEPRRTPESAMTPAARPLERRKAIMTTGGFSKARLRRMHDVMAGHVERGGVPGIVTLVSRKGEAHVDAVGALAMGGAPVRRNSVFRVASMTKPVTAVAAMMLVEESKLRLDDPMDGLLPELANRRVLKRVDGPLDDTVPARRPVTLRDLLTFRWGFGQMMASPDTVPVLKAAVDLKIGMGPPEPAAIPAPDEWLRRLGTLPLMHQPGEGWTYHTGADVLGVLIARASGQPFEDFLRDRIFGPLGMKDTAFNASTKQMERFATSYWTNFQTGAVEVYDPAQGGQWSRPPAFPSGGGGLVSTVDDFLAFGQMMLNGGKLGKERVLSRRSVELMTANHLTPEQKSDAGIFLGSSQGWGFGMSVIVRRDNLGDSIGKYGWDGGLGTSWYVDLQEELIGVLLTQQMWTSPSPPKVQQDFWTTAHLALES